jgi:hypothetical protein
MTGKCPGMFGMPGDLEKLGRLQSRGKIGKKAGRDVVANEEKISLRDALFKACQVVFIYL